MNYRKLVFFVLTAVLFACGSTSELDSAENLHKKGVVALESQNYIKAISFCSDGINQIAELYSDPKVIDDTGMKLTLANIEKEKSNNSVSANLYCNVLESRISIFKNNLESM